MDINKHTNAHTIPFVYGAKYTAANKRVCQNSFSVKDNYHFVKNYRYQRVNNSMITVTLIFMRE